MPKAAVCPAVGSALEVVDVGLDDPKAGEVRVRMGASGVCHSDLSVVNGTLLSPLPAVLGHEGAGVVEAIGEGVTLVRPGDHVITLFAPECGECVHCRSPWTNRCVAIREQQNAGYLPDGTTRLSR